MSVWRFRLTVSWTGTVSGIMCDSELTDIYKTQNAPHCFTPLSHVLNVQAGAHSSTQLSKKDENILWVSVAAPHRCVYNHLFDLYGTAADGSHTGIMHCPSHRSDYTRTYITLTLYLSLSIHPSICDIEDSALGIAGLQSEAFGLYSTQRFKSPSTWTFTTSLR